MFDNTPNYQSVEALTLHEAHKLQIEALLKPGLSKEERVEEFSKAAEFTDEQLRMSGIGSGRYSPAGTVWFTGTAEKSIFADLPNCSCPVIETQKRVGDWKDIPTYIPDDWSPTAEVLWAFSRIQIKARTGETL